LQCRSDVGSPAFREAATCEKSQKLLEIFTCAWIMVLYISELSCSYVNTVEHFCHLVMCNNSIRPMARAVSGGNLGKLTLDR